MAKRISDTVYAETEPDRHRHEVDYVSKQPAEWIKDHLAGVHDKRGQDAYMKLRSDVLKVWKK